MLISPVDSLNDFISKVFIAIAIGALVFGLSLLLATIIYPHFMKWPKCWKILLVAIDSSHLVGYLRFLMEWVVLVIGFHQKNDSEEKVWLDNVSSDNVSLNWEEEITANDGTKMKNKEINNMNKLLLTYFINESYDFISSNDQKLLFLEPRIRDFC
jgi:hypothetical protein